MSDDTSSPPDEPIMVNLSVTDDVIRERRPVRNKGQFPEQYLLWERSLLLPNGNRESAFYSTHADLTVDPEAPKRSSDALIEGMVWALTVDAFTDGETADDDRMQEIGNMMSFGMTCGLSEQQVLDCYVEAFVIVYVMMHSEQ